MSGRRSSWQAWLNWARNEAGLRLRLTAASGFEPVRAERKITRLRNCPFHRLAERSRELICGMNVEFFAGVVDGVGGPVQVTLVPWEGHCCVELHG